MTGDSPSTRRRFLRGLGVTGAVVAGGAATSTTASAASDDDLTLGFDDEFGRWPAWAAERFAPTVERAVETRDMNGNCYGSWTELTLAERFSPSELLSIGERLTGERDDVFDLLTAQEWWTEEEASTVGRALPAEAMDAFDRVLDVATTPAIYDGGATHAVPLTLDLAPLAYDTRYFDDPPTSLATLWDEELSGRLLVRHFRARYAALHAGQAPDDPDDFDAVADALAGQEPLLYDLDTDESVTDAFEGPVVAGIVPWHLIFSMRFEDELPVDYVVPEEGAFFQGYHGVVPARSRHPDLARRFLDWATRPEHAAELVTRAGRKPAVDIAEHVPERYREFLTWPEDATYHPDDQLDDEVSVRYWDLMREHDP
jgi:spermidine/putrescine-binding protein